MPIYVDREKNRTVCECDVCGETAQTDIANGVVVEDWGTGHLWLDTSLSEQVQTPICFCPPCSGEVMNPMNVVRLKVQPAD